MKHPRDIGALGVESFLTMLATERKVSASTHNQALSAVLFLYREVLGLRRCHQSAKEVAVQRGEVLCPERAVIVANVQLKTDYGVTGVCCTKRQPHQIRSANLAPDLSTRKGGTVGVEVQVALFVGLELISCKRGVGGHRKHPRGS